MMKQISSKVIGGAIVLVGLVTVLLLLQSYAGRSLQGRMSAGMIEDMRRSSEEMIERCKAAVAAHPEDARAWEKLGNAYISSELVYWEKGLLQEASRCFLKAHELQPEDHHVLLQLAFVYQRLKETGKASEAVSQAYQIAPDDQEVIRRMADIAYAQKDYAAAEKYMAMERSRGSDWNAGRYARYGNALFQLARYDDLIAVLEPASTPKPVEVNSKAYSMTADDYGQLNYMLALAYLQKGDKQQARKSYQKAGKYFDYAKSGWHAAQQAEIVCKLKELQ